MDNQCNATGKIPIIEEKIKNINKRISNLESERMIYGYFDGN